MRGPALAGVQFFFTLGWTVYVIFLPGLLKSAGIEASWLPWLLMADQLVFAAMDIAFGFAADRIANDFRRLARLLLSLTTISALAFLLLPMLADVSASGLMLILAIWVISASVVRAPTMILLAKQAKAAQQRSLVIWYAAGVALASGLSPFLGLGLKGLDPRIPFALSALVLVGAVLVLLRVATPSDNLKEEPQGEPLRFLAFLPQLLVLALASAGFQLHAFVNAMPLYRAQTVAENLPWVMPVLWLGFFAALPLVARLIGQLGAMRVAMTGMLLAAGLSYLAAAVNSLESLILLQLLTGAAWALAFAGLMESAAVAGVRGAEGVFTGSFFSVLALTTFCRIGFASQYLSHSAALQNVQFLLPSVLLFAAGGLGFMYWLKTRQSPSGPVQE